MLKTFDAGCVVLFGLLALVVGFFVPEMLPGAVRFCVEAGLCIVALFSLVTGPPFTLQYARDVVDSEQAASPRFVRLHIWISLVWAAAFGAMAGADAAALAVAGIGMTASTALGLVAAAAALTFTLRYPAYAGRRAARARPEERNRKGANVFPASRKAGRIRPARDDSLRLGVFPGTWRVRRDRHSQYFRGHGRGIGIGLAQLVYKQALSLPIGPLQWLSLVIVCALGGMTLITRDSRLHQAQTSVIDFAVGLFMATRDWISPYLPQFVKDNVSARTVARANYGWAALMIGFSAINVVIAFTAEFWIWLVYATFIPTAIIAALFVVQYFVFSALARRNQRARLAGQAVELAGAGILTLFCYFAK